MANARLALRGLNLSADKTVEEQLAIARDYAARLLTQHRDALERVANALFKCRVLTGAQVGTLLA